MPRRPAAAARRLLVSALSVLLAFVASPARAEEPLVVEETFLGVEIKGRPFRLQALVVKEAGAGGRRLPVALVTHGQAAEAERRERVEPASYLRAARDLARRGWLAVVVVRRGFGRSEGEQPYALRGCRDGDYAPLLDDQTDDLEAALRAIARRSDADAGQVLALGVSVGGAAVLNLAARRPEGLKAVVNVSGGVRVRQREGGPPVTCTPEDLVPLFGRLGGRAKALPTLWLYAENDSLFPADQVRRLHEAYVAGGGRTDFHVFEPIGSDGHAIFASNEGLLRWLPALDRFLRANRLPTFDLAPLDAAARDLGFTAEARRLLARYHGRPTEKVLAVSRSNRTLHATYGTRDLAEAEGKAVQECEKAAKQPCRIVLRNFEVVAENVRPGEPAADAPPPPTLPAPRGTNPP